ncbi:MAG: bacteriochlorophyll 4-vinyl reductase [Labrys sp. (in: a-proteobacteria)]
MTVLGDDLGASARPGAPARLGHRATAHVGVGDERAGRVGPNAITRVSDTLVDQCGAAVRDRVFLAADLIRHVAEPPTAMVDENEVAALHASLHAVLGEAAARRVAREAGRRTGDYIIANRIPSLVRLLLACLPAAPAARLLVKAITRHAWTFAGSGSFAVEDGPPLTFVISGGPLSKGVATHEPACDYFAATFERLFQRLVSARAVVVETACVASGDTACRFAIRW